jgi:hypothetical protein
MTSACTLFFLHMQALKAQLASLTMPTSTWTTHAAVAAAPATLPAAAAAVPLDNALQGALPVPPAPVLPLAAAVQHPSQQLQCPHLQQQPLEQPFQHQALQQPLQQEPLQQEQFQFGAGSSYMDTTDPVTLMYLNATFSQHDRT